MSSVECLRELMNERLTAAAEEIFRVFQKTIVEYEKEIDRQSRLLDIVWKPEIKLQRIELLQQHVCKEEEVLTDQQLCNQERNSSLDQEDPEPPQIKEEQAELCTSLEGEQLVLKQETETFMLTPTCKESDNGEDQTEDSDEIQSAAEKEHVVSMLVKSSVVPEPNSIDQLLSHNSHVVESQDHKGGKQGDSGSPGNAETKPKKRHQNTSKIHSYIYTGKKSLKNNTCGKAFKCKSYLNKHPRVHAGEKSYNCETCGKGFSRMSDFKKHMRIHTGEKPYPCNTCEKRFSRRDILQTHMRVHTGEKPYPCNTCEKRFSELGNLKRHMRTHTRKKPYTCNTCEKRFSLPGTLKAHMKGQESDNSEDQMEDSDETQSAAEKEHVVSMLVKSSVVPEPNSDDQLLSHNSHVAESQGHKGGKYGDSGSTGNTETKPKKRHHRRKNPTNNEDNSTTSKIHSNIYTGKKSLKCNTCEKRFTQRSALLLHMKVHIGEKLYPCNTCGKAFQCKSNLNKNLRVHAGEKVYPCNTCGKIFSLPSTLRVHMRIHTGEKPYSCNTCEKRFSQLGNLKLHMRVHTGEKPYPCNTCEKRFSERGKLKVHMRIHTGEKPYSCKTCGKDFTRGDHLKIHMRTHSRKRLSDV
ncbi:zinc finger protein ZFP2-like isoform X3 [Thunnus thynnus]|uniref:zinc finger protein ZFP2-like isoform X3 n=1 Tax=Thunnus thynnus TaxID=8237 RepID=UPI003527A101